MAPVVPAVRAAATVTFSQTDDRNSPCDHAALTLTMTWTATESIVSPDPITEKSKPRQLVAHSWLRALVPVWIVAYVVLVE